MAKAAASSRKRKCATFFEEEEQEQQEELFFENQSEEEQEESSRAAEDDEGGSQDGEQPECQSNNKGSINVSLTVPDVLDCDICFEHLTAPVFQCKNGHIACSQCCQLLKNRCPSCRLRIGSIRCRALETILESIRVSCQYTSYGCQETSLLYSQKQHHETTCLYAPCSCPFANCDCQSSANQLPLHFNEKHPDRSGYSFKYDSTFSIKLDRNVECIVIKEKEGGDLFAITKYPNDLFGNDAVVVSRIIGASVQRRHPYKLTARINEADGISTLKIQSFTRNHVSFNSSKGTTPPPAGTFLMIPKDYQDGGCSDLRQVRLALCIHPSI
ncbi:Ubiquitin-protein ligase putative isoform 2 [Tripterygium wilfordii]|uniref:RING-type E3 ubiquitin transferase n=1 Tax=Tripterygium wilfordii TaxID=458696 RepID=A0A7J7D8Y2_TRIWF|nr:Ubiquitin-protein ligase putative isoform 2 [Tripterygium wilfordii]